MIKIKLWGALSCLILCSFLFACPSGLNIKNVLEKGAKYELVLVAEQLVDCPQWQDSLAMLYHKLSIQYYQQKNINAAIDFTEKALGIRDEIYKKNFHVDLGKSYYNLGVFYKKTGEFLLAKYYLEQSIIVFEKLAIRNRLRNSKYELSEIYKVGGEFQKSETLLKYLINTSLTDEGFYKTKYLVLLSDNYRVQHKFELAKNTLEEAIIILSQETNAIFELAQAHHNLGIVYYQLENYQGAIFHFDKAIDFYNAADGTSVELSRNYNSRGLAYLKTGDFQNAQNNFEQGLQKAQSIDQTRFIAQSYDNLGELYFTQQKFRQSNTVLDQALQTVLPALGTSKYLDKNVKAAIRQSPFKIDLLVYLSDQIRSLKALYLIDKNKVHLKNALTYLEIGDYLIDQLRESHSDQSTKLFWREEARPFYEKAVQICSYLKNVDQAFYYFEKSKSILLLEALLASNALQSIPEDKRRAIKYIERQISIKRAILDKENKKQNAQLLKEILDLEARLDSLNAVLIKEFPQLKEQNSVHSVSDLQAFSQTFLSEPNKAFVHYFYGEEYVYALVLDQQKQQLLNLGESTKITPLIRGFLQFFEQADLITAQPEAYLLQAAKVYDAIVKPLDLQKDNHLLIIPSGILSYLPFEALVTAEVGHSYSLANAPYLLQSHPVCYGFSATFFDQLERRPQHRFKKSLLAYAPFANRSTAVYPSLDFSQDELSKVASLVDIDLQLNQQATLTQFLSDHAAYSIVHLSTHAYASFSEEQPHIVFADSSFYLMDLYQQYIPANLVVLSACQTQIGKLAPGEGVLGLSRGFFYAGARSVVASLWNLNAQSSASILTDFYQAMAEKKPKFLALHQAKINYLADENIPTFQKSPYYWAGMNYYGDSGLWQVKTKSLWWLYWLGVVLFVVVLGRSLKQ